MKAVLISIQPKWCELIANGKKAIEVRKTKPKLETPFKVYIYCTDKKSTDNSWQYKPNLYRDSSGKVRWIDVEFESIFNCEYLQQKVIGEFICDKIIDIDYGIEEGVYFDGEYQEGFETNGNGNNPACLSFVDLENYLTENEGYGWHISNLVIYDKPRELKEFSVPKEYKTSTQQKQRIYKSGLKVPQSWCYVESEVEGE